MSKLKKPFYSVSYNGAGMNYKCYKLKTPFRKLCDKKIPDDCWNCDFFKVEMKVRDALRLMSGLDAIKEEINGIR
jgi:hypothetical protein